VSGYAEQFLPGGVMQDIYVPLSNSVAKAITEMIFLQKRFKAGDRIPSEMELATELQVSRTSIREGVRLLIARGVLRIARGKGTFVAASPDAADGLLSIPLIENQRLLVRDWFEFRLILEPQSAMLATVRATPKEFEAIEHFEQLGSSHIADREIFYDADTKLHIAIARATHNQVIKRLVPFLQDAVAEARRRTQYIPPDKPDIVAENAAVSHREIVSFMRMGDAEGASIAMGYHIKRAKVDLEL
jgi:DNA-binding FadR family transcriptional regulator